MAGGTDAAGTGKGRPGEALHRLGTARAEGFAVNRDSGSDGHPATDLGGDMAKEYVLLKQHPRTNVVTFVGGTDPCSAAFCPTRAGATRFPTPGEALTFRDQMARQPGGAGEYHVHELVQDGRLMNVEP